jgi:hypothetical protein
MRRVNRADEASATTSASQSSMRSLYFICMAFFQGSYAEHLLGLGPRSNQAAQMLTAQMLTYSTHALCICLLTQLCMVRKAACMYGVTSLVQSLLIQLKFMSIENKEDKYLKDGQR